MSTLIAEDLQPFVAEAVRTGRYRDETAVVEAALKLLRELHSSDVTTKIDAALAQSHAGEVIKVSGIAEHREYFDSVRRGVIHPPADAK